jgi:diguanylate cyclase (GGDEF)-like protein
LKVLIADDDLTSREILVSVMSKWGFNPIAVEDGLKVLEVMSQPDAPQLLMLDWEMPGLDGLSLAEHLTANETNPEPPYVIMLTSRDGQKDIVTGLSAGANDYITKPFETDVLRARVNVARRTVELQQRLTSALRKLSILANIDELTELHNRRSSLNKMTVELERAERQNSELCLGICDIDHFKQINDTLGHQAGDQVLKQLGGMLKNEFRSYDIIGRYGGEEFVFAIPTHYSGAKSILERIRSQIAGTPFVTDEKVIRISMSFGAVMVAHDQQSDLEYWLKKADNALYHSKKQGRDCISFAGTEAQIVKLA